MDPEEIPLPAGRMTQGIVRRGDRVLRPAGPWSGAVHEYLRHLEFVGFEGAPRFLGTDGARDILTFVDGGARELRRLTDAPMAAAPCERPPSTVVSRIG